MATTGALSTTTFIAVVSSVGGVVVVIAVVMMCAFACYCYREYYKRRVESRKESDRVGLLRSKGEEEDVVSDEGDNKIPLSNMSQQSGSEGQCTPPEKKASFMATVMTSKVAPAPEQAGESDAKRSGSKKHKRRSNTEDGSQKKKLKSSPQQQRGEESPHEDRRVTMIGDSSDEGDGLNAAVDDGGDEVQLVQPKEKASPKGKNIDVETRAQMLGRPVSYLKKLSKSAPLDVAAMAKLVNTERNPLTSQYMSVPSNAVELPHLSAAENAKNRYRNVLPNPHSTVQLRYAGTEGSTYINANFIRGLHSEEKAYIAAQGPIFDTMQDFWRMIWEKDVSIIVMLTNLIENGRHKCAKYWPPTSDSDTVVHGNIEVTKTGEEAIPSNYTLSYLRVKNLETGEERDTYHFWYVAWPDFGIPRDAEPILKLRSAVASHRAGSPPGPVVVHCSAGLGRSGTFIAIDMGIQQYEEAGVVDPLKYLCEMRQDRGGMVQTEDQYWFIHKALGAYMK